MIVIIIVSDRLTGWTTCSSLMMSQYCIIMVLISYHTLNSWMDGWMSTDCVCVCVWEGVDGAGRGWGGWGGGKVGRWGGWGSEEDQGGIDCRGQL